MQRVTAVAQLIAENAQDVANMLYNREESVAE